MGLKMTLDNIKDKVPSSIKLVPDEDTDSIDVIVDGFYAGYLNITSEGVYYKTFWGRTTSINCDDYIRTSKFLSYLRYDLLITLRCSNHMYQIYRLIE